MNDTSVKAFNDLEDKVKLLETKLKKFEALNLKVLVSGTALVVYSPVTAESIALPLTKKSMQFLLMKFPGLR